MGNDRKITNTRTRPPELLMLDMLAGGPGAIEAMEARGQSELVANGATLPAKGSEHPAWAAMGVTFGPPDPADPIFRPATLPAGWKIQRTDHSMWSELVDEKGRKRASIFYKAAFYDRDAFVTLCRRFNIRSVFVKDRDDRQQEVVDGETRIFITGAVPRSKDWQENEATDNAQQAECVAFLAPKFPNWEDPAAHWND